MKFKLIFLSLCFSILITSIHCEGKLLKEKPMVVLTTSYNNKKWVRKNLRSILTQEYTNFRLIYIDDCSKDETFKKAQRYINKTNLADKVLLILNKERIGALANIYNSITNLIEDDEIVVSLDGDDWFAHSHVLSDLNKAYSDENVWLTHGTLREFPGGSSSWSIPIPENYVSNGTFRDYRCPSHLRTFYAWLFKKIELEDLQTEEEIFFPMAWDQAIMFPMIEMAGERHKFLSEVSYVYNVANVINDNKVDPKCQRDLEHEIRSLVPYDRLEDRDDVPFFGFESL